VTLQLSVSEKLIKTRTRCASVHVAGRWWQTRCCSEQIPLFTCRAENRIIISGWLKMQAWRWQTTKKRDRQCKSEWRMGFVESLLSVLISLLRLINLCWEINTLRPVALTVMYSIPFSISFSALLLHFLFMIFVVFRTLLRNGRRMSTPATFTPQAKVGHSTRWESSVKSAMQGQTLTTDTDGRRSRHFWRPVLTADSVGLQCVVAVNFGWYRGHYTTVTYMLLDS